MSRVCSKCGRGPKSSVSRSHSNIATKRTQQINLQMVTVSGKRVKLCTKCIKSAHKKSK